MSAEALGMQELETLGFQIKNTIKLADQVEIQEMAAQYTFSCLAISYQHDSLVALYNDQLIICKLGTLSKLLENPELNKKDVLQSPEVSRIDCVDGSCQIYFNFDCSKLYLISFMGDLYQYDSNDLLVNGKLTQLKLDKFGNSIMRFLPSFSANDSLIITGSNELFLLSEEGSNKLLDNVSACNWVHKSNNQVVYSLLGSNKVTICQLNNKNDGLTPVKEYQLPLEDPIELINDFKFFDESSFIALVSDAEIPNDQLTYIITADGQINQCDTILTPFAMIDRLSFAYVGSLPRWSKTYPKLLVGMSSKSDDISILTPEYQLKPLNDHDNANMPMVNDGDDDCTPLGFVIDVSSTEEFIGPCQGIDKCEPLPRIYILNDVGELLSWDLWLSDEIKNDNLNLKNCLNELTSGQEYSTSHVDNTEESKDEQKDELIGDSKVETKKEPTISNPFANVGSNNSGFGSSGFGSSGFGSSAFGKSSFTPNENTKSFSLGQGGFGSFASNNNNNASSPFGSATAATNAADSPFGKLSLGSKNNDSPFGNIASKESPFGNLGEKKDSPFGASSFGNLAEKKDSPFGNIGEKKDSPFGAIAKDSPFVNLGEKKDSPFGTISKASPFASLGEKMDLPFDNIEEKKDFSFGTIAKDSPFANLGEKNDSPFGASDEKKMPPFGTVSKDSPFGNLDKKNDSPFGTISKDSPFGNFGEKKDSPFAVISNHSPFANSNVKKDSLSGNVGKKDSLFGANEEKSNSLFDNESIDTKQSAIFPSTFGQNKTATSFSFKPQGSPEKDQPKSIFGNKGTVNPFGSNNKSIFTPSQNPNEIQDNPFGNAGTLDDMNQLATSIENDDTVEGMNFANEDEEEQVSEYLSKDESEAGSEDSEDSEVELQKQRLEQDRLLKERFEKNHLEEAQLTEELNEGESKEPESQSEQEEVEKAEPEEPGWQSEEDEVEEEHEDEESEADLEIEPEIQSVADKNSNSEYKLKTESEIENEQKVEDELESDESLPTGDSQNDINEPAQKPHTEPTERFSGLLDSKYALPASEANKGEEDTISSSEDQELDQKSQEDDTTDLVNVTLSTIEHLITANENISPRNYETKSIQTEDKNQSILAFEGEESYQSKFYIPKSLPLLVATNKVEYPEDLSKYSEVSKEIMKIIYDVEAEFLALEKNHENFNEYIIDHAENRIMTHSLKHSYMSPSHWRFFEINNVAKSIRKLEPDYESILASTNEIYKPTLGLKRDIIDMSMKASTLNNEIQAIEKSITSMTYEAVDYNRPLPLGQVQMMKKLKAHVKKLNSSSHELSQLCMLLKAKLNPELILTARFDSILSSIQKSIYQHMESLRTLQKQAEQMKKLGTNSDCDKHNNELEIKEQLSEIQDKILRHKKLSVTFQDHKVVVKNSL